MIDYAETGDLWWQRAGVEHVCSWHEQAPCELEPACCPACGGSGEDETRRTRVLAFGGSYSPGDYACDACEGTGYATPADYWAACAAELGDL